MDSYQIFPCDAPDVVIMAGSGYRASLPLHKHGGLEITYMARGCVTWQVEDQMEEVPSGSVFYTFPWEKHGSTHEFDPGHFWYFVELRGDEPASDAKVMKFCRLGFSKAENAEIMRTLAAASQRSWPATERIAGAVKDLVHETMHPTQWSGKIRSALGKLLLLELARIVSEGPSTAPKEKFSPKIQQLIQKIQAHPEKKWTLAEMAKSCGQHRTYFIKAVRDLTGDTPMLFLRRLRIERARELLRTDNAITQIALDCGFESSQHFARIFREFTGQSASAYRKNPHT